VKKPKINEVHPPGYALETPGDESREPAPYYAEDEARLLGDDQIDVANEFNGEQATGMFVSGDVLAELREHDQDRRAWALKEARSILRSSTSALSAGPTPPRDDLLIIAEYILDGTLPFEYTEQGDNA
jgi:hypothetical protein